MPTKAQLLQRIAELEAEIAHTEKVNTQVNLLAAGGEPDGSFCIELQSKVWPLIAHSLMVWFEQNGGVNYIEQVVDFPADQERKSSLEFTTARGMFILTLQKKFMKTPHQFRLEAEAEVKALRDGYQKALVAALEALDAVAHAGPSQDGVERCHYCEFPWDGPHDPEGCRVKDAVEIVRSSMAKN